MPMPVLGDDMAQSFSTEDNTTYYRRYANGLVYFNSSSKHGWLENGETINNISISTLLYDAHSNQVTFTFSINKEYTGSEQGKYNIPDTETTAFVWNWTTIYLNTSDFDYGGRYDVYNSVYPATTIPEQGGNIGYYQDVMNDADAWYDNGASPNNWLLLGANPNRNWIMNLKINKTYSTSIDTTSRITQTNTSDSTTGKYNLTLSSGVSFPLRVISDVWCVPLTSFSSLTYWNGTGVTKLHPQNTTTCDGNNPILNITTIANEEHKSCFVEKTNQVCFRVSPPSLSTRIYTLNGVTTLGINFTTPIDANNSFINSRNWTYINLSVINNNIGDTIIINWNGTNITVWDKNLVALWHLDNDTSDALGDLKKNLTIRYNITCGIETNTAPPSPYGGSCFTNKSNYSNSYCGELDTNNSDAFNDLSAMTLCAWYYPMGYIGQQGIISKRHNANPWYSFGFQRLSARGLTWRVANFSTIGSLSNTTSVTNNSMPLETWVFICGTYDSSTSTTTLWVNGTRAGENTIKNNIAHSDGNFYIGADYLCGSGTVSLNGSIDEIRIYNRSLSENEIKALYNMSYAFYKSGAYFINITNQTDGAYTYYGWINDTSGNNNATETRTITFDITNPAIAFRSPENNTFKNQSWIFINITLNDTNFANVTYELWNGTQQLNTTNYSTLQNTINFTGLPDGVYYFNSTARDRAINVNITETRIITLDSINPSVTFGFGTSSNNLGVDRFWIYFNVTYNETNFNNITFFVYNYTSALGYVPFQNVTYSNSTTDINFTSLTYGTYYYNSTVNDKVSQSGRTETRKIILEQDITESVSVLGSSSSFVSSEIYNMTTNETICSGQKIVYNGIEYCVKNCINGTVVVDNGKFMCISCNTGFHKEGEDCVLDKTNKETKDYVSDFVNLVGGSINKENPTLGFALAVIIVIIAYLVISTGGNKKF